MTIKNIFATLLLMIAATGLHAQEKNIKSFLPGSYQQILRENTNQPFILAIWSVDCPSCLKDMENIRAIHNANPDLNIIMLSTDDITTTPEIKNLLLKYQLADLENWVFASEDAQKLRYEIDPAWYGEQPRIYFYNAAHQRIGKSGALTMTEFELQIGKIKP